MKRLLAFMACLMLAPLPGCGGGGDGSSASTPPGSGQTPPPPPPVNRSPVLVNAPVDQHLVVNHPFEFDMSQGGTAVSDPDGDTLTYTVMVTPLYTTEMPPGLTLKGTVISGTPTEAGFWGCEVSVDDGHGGNSVQFTFNLNIAPNSPPAAVNGNKPVLVAAGSHVDYDATQGNSTFVDPDGDPISYSMTMRGQSHGLSITGARITGTFDAVGAVEFTITAKDAYGGTGVDSFLIAAPAAVPAAAPVLPSSSYVYRDEDLPLPWVFAMSSQSMTPLWDMQRDNRTTNAGATLGRVLFYDKRLSITNTHACASCHQQALNFSSPQRFDTGILGIPLPRTTMPLANVRYNINSAWFSDMRATEDLRNQIFMPIDNHDELGMGLFPVETKLASAAFYPPLFAAAFGTPDITRERIAAALAQFLQSLITYQSKWDSADSPMDNSEPNPAAVLSAQELQGMDIYLQHCSMCHERFAQTNVWQANNGLDSVLTDLGTTIPAMQRNGALGVFRAASLRNIAVSAPYMHDGRFASLREVIDHYDHGVQAGPNTDSSLMDFNGNPQQLHLTEDDKLALEAFLDTFTDTGFLTNPKFSNPFPP